jgi:cyanate permease
LLFGIGWAVACLTVTVLLVRYFGNKRGTAALSAIWMLCGVAAFGPSLAGYVADQGHGFGPVLAAMGAVLVPLAFASLVMRAPGSHVAEAGKYVLS